MSNNEAKKPRILIGGVPFGRDNVGDEAIIECVVNIVRELRPDAELWVSTDDQKATGKKLDVKTHPLFGFDPPGFDREEMRQAIRDCDLFIWSGATGLSDYPDIPLELMEYAQEQKKLNVIFNTGMNDELNPALYKLLPGKRRMVFSAIKTLTLGISDLTKDWEDNKRNKTLDSMRRVIPNASLVILRDSQSKTEVTKVLGDDSMLNVGADPAITLACPEPDTCSFNETTLKFLDQSAPKVGLCISAQRAVKQMTGMQEMFDRLMAKRGIKLVGIPMNPITDAALLEDFREGLAKPEDMHVIQGRYEPDEINAAASKMDVVISSRLHLLILASITLTPFIGISRGTKVTNFTSQFGLPDIGSVDTLDLELFSNEIERLIDERAEFRTKAKAVRFEMLARLSKAKEQLADVLSKLPRKASEA